MRGLIDITDLSVQELYELMDVASDIMEHPEQYREKCRYKKLATLFFEPSTRTRLSFEAAMQELGGSVISVAGTGNSSAVKGESISDTAKMVSCYADILAMRHPIEGSAQVALMSASIPVINAGDGGHCHPTQTLADLMTIYKEKGRLENLTVGLCGDLKYGRTVHSLIAALSRYTCVKFVLISPEELKIPNYVRKGILIKNNIPYEETASLEDALPKLDILYMTRIQRERFDSPADYERLKDVYILTAEKMSLASPECIVMHPLPRVNEISVQVDNDPRACYFKQALYGKFMRMALILKLLFGNEEINRPASFPLPGHFCTNPRCAYFTERELPPLFKKNDGEDKYRCYYCESGVK